MTAATDLTQGESIGNPQFIEKINYDFCLSCDIFYEIGSRNALKLQFINKDNNNNEHQIMTVGNPEKCADCQICTSS